MAGWARVGVAVARRPRLWFTAARQALVLVRPGWWRARPPLPTPDPAYLQFRAATQYGDPHRVPEPGDVVTYLGWCRAYYRRAR